MRASARSHARGAVSEQPLPEQLGRELASADPTARAVDAALQVRRVGTAVPLGSQYDLWPLLSSPTPDVSRRVPVRSHQGLADLATGNQRPSGPLTLLPLRLRGQACRSGKQSTNACVYDERRNHHRACVTISMFPPTAAARFIFVVRQACSPSSRQGRLQRQPSGGGSAGASAARTRRGGDLLPPVDHLDRAALRRRNGLTE